MVKFTGKILRTQGKVNLKMYSILNPRRLFAYIHMVVAAMITLRISTFTELLILKGVTLNVHIYYIAVNSFRLQYFYSNIIPMSLFKCIHSNTPSVFIHVQISTCFDQITLAYL